MTSGMRTTGTAAIIDGVGRFAHDGIIVDAMVFSDGGEGLGEVGHARMTMLAHDWLLDVEVEKRVRRNGRC